VLGRGYAIVADARGAIVRDAAALAPGASVEITLAEGGATATVDRVRRSNP
jgi:exodeoxyribonuclease VII large subunit